MAHAPGETGCGLRVDGRDIGISFGGVPDAEGAASQLVAHGYRQIEIFDRASGRIISERRLAPPMARPSTHLSDETALAETAASGVRR